MLLVQQAHPVLVRLVCLARAVMLKPVCLVQAVMLKLVWQVCQELPRKAVAKALIVLVQAPQDLLLERLVV